MKHITQFDKDWLAGFIDADGTISCTQTSTGKVQTAIKITQKNTNTKALIACKKLMGAGKLTHEKHQMMCFRIRKHHVLKTHIFPLLDQTHFHTHKHFAYQHLKNYVLQRIWTPYVFFLSPPRWHTILGDQAWTHLIENKWLSHTNARKVLTLGWLTGFIEGDGSFYITKKEEGRYACGFGVTQKHGQLLLVAIRAYLKIKAQVKPHAQYPDVWMLDSTSADTCFFIASVFKKCFKGVTSLRFKIWCRALSSRHNALKMEKYQALLRKVSCSKTF